MTASRWAGQGPPLAGVKLLDFSTFLAGPFCTQILGDLGAEVVKVEPPEGDSSRTIPPHSIGGESLYYLSVNRNKKSVVIDLKNPAGRDVALSMIGKVDVVVENFGPGVCRRLGIDSRALCAEHPHLIWSSVTGFGRVGNRSELPAYDLIVQALSGVMTLTGEPGGAHVRLGIPAGDLVAGLYCCIGVLAGLAERDRSAAREVDVAMFDGLLSTISYLGAYTLLTGESPGAQGSGHESIPTYRSFVGADGETLVVTANTDRMWRALCEVLHLDGLIQDSRFATAASRLLNKDALWPLLESAFGSRSAMEWVKLLNANDVPAAMVKDVSGALDDARNDTRSMVLGMKSPMGDFLEVAGNPVKYLGDVPREPDYPPRLGENTMEVLVGVFGFAEGEVRSLLDSGAVQSARTFDDQ